MNMLTRNNIRLLAPGRRPRVAKRLFARMGNIVLVEVQVNKGGTIELQASRPPKGRGPV
jgi:hypothetical protein